MIVIGAYGFVCRHTIDFKKWCLTSTGCRTEVECCQRAISISYHEYFLQVVNCLLIMGRSTSLGGIHRQV
jgi:hypothetical protein